MKATQPLHELQATIPWVVDAPHLARFVGVCEVLGALGLLLPSVLRVKPKLTVLAAAALALVMVAAMVFHGIRGEYPMIGVDMVFFAAPAFIAYGRLVKAPIVPRRATSLLTAH
jgi:hypothetical protein